MAQQLAAGATNKDKLMAREDMLLKTLKPKVILKKPAAAIDLEPTKPPRTTPRTPWRSPRWAR
eukprot:277266-Alexandrium_andersonii.AAC.1